MNQQQITVLTDSRLSYKAKGLYAYMVAQKVGTVFSTEALADVSKDGRDSVRNGLKELKDLGYYKQTKTRGHSSTFTWESWVFGWE